MEGPRPEWPRTGRETDERGVSDYLECVAPKWDGGDRGTGEPVLGGGFESTVLEGSREVETQSGMAKIGKRKGRQASVIS